MNNFDLKKFLTENKLTKDSQIVEGLDDGFELTAADVAAIAGDQPLKVYKRGGGRVVDYDNGQQFLRLFDKHEPGLVYKQEKPGVFAAKVKPEEPKGEYIPSAPLSKADQDASMQSYYDSLGRYKGD